MPPASGKEKLQTGRCGELLVQSRLLRHGIESSAMTLDYGIDLIALRMGPDNKITSVVSIQVKTTATLFKSGEQEGYSWSFPEKSPANLIAFVATDKIPERIWLFDYAKLRELRNELRKKSKSSNKGSNFDLYTKAVQTPWTIENFESHLLENLEDKLSPPTPALPSK